MKRNFSLIFFGVVTGILNGLFGAGGGIIAVEVLKHYGLNQKQAQSTSIAVILPLCIISSILYFINKSIPFSQMYILIPTGILGALFGTFLMKKMSCELLKKIFCLVMIYAGVRMFF